MRLGGSIDDLQRQIGNAEPAYFQPVDDKLRVAVITSTDERDRRRAHQAAKQDQEHYQASDTRATADLQHIEGITRENMKYLRDIIQARTAQVAVGRVEIYAMNNSDPRFFDQACMAAIHSETVTHINGVPREMLARGSREEQLEALHASELVRDKARGMIQSYAAPGDYYTRQSPPKGDLTPAAPSWAHEKTPPAVLKKVREFQVELAKEGKLKCERRDRPWDRDF